MPGMDELVAPNNMSFVLRVLSTAVAKPIAASRIGAPFCWPKVSKNRHTRGRDRHWLDHSRQVSAGLVNGRSKGKGAV